MYKKKHLKQKLQELLAVAVGGFLGCIFRYFISTYFHQSSPLQSGGFPIGIFIVNMIGVFLIGFCSVLLVSSKNLVLKAFVFVGLIGGFTTVSSYIYDSLHLFMYGYAGVAIMNLLASVLFGLGFCLLGILLSRKLISRSV